VRNDRVVKTAPAEIRLRAKTNGQIRRNHDFGELRVRRRAANVAMVSRKLSLTRAGFVAAPQDRAHGNHQQRAGARRGDCRLPRKCFAKIGDQIRRDDTIGRNDVAGYPAKQSGARPN
jgi:hypothetical protein